MYGNSSFIMRRDEADRTPQPGEALSSRRFEGGDWAEQLIEKVSFEDCVFTDLGLEKSEFLDCSFIGCGFHAVRMNLANVKGSGFQNVRFKQSRLQGIDWQATAKGMGFLDVVFEGCAMEYGSFSRMKCGGTVFKNCRLQEIDFSEAKAGGVIFEESDLKGAVFQRTDLRKADFSKAVNYALDPSENQVRDALFSMPEAVGLLREFGVKLV